MSVAQATTQTYLDSSLMNTWNISDSTWDAGAKWINGNDAVFVGNGESVVVGDVSVHHLTINSPNYLLSGGTIIMVGITPTIDGSASVTIQSVIAGTNGLAKSGASVLTLSGANTYTGDTTVNAGILAVNSAFFDDSSTISIASGSKIALNTGTTDTAACLILGGDMVGPGIYDASHETYGGYFSGNGSLAVASGDYDSWIASKGLDGADALPAADPDFDGIGNAVEFVIGGEPNPSNPGSDSCALLPTVSLAEGIFTFTFRRTGIAAGYDPLVEYSDNLSGWTDAEGGVDGVVIHETSDGFGLGVDRVEVSIPMEPGSTLFARLQVTVP